MERREVGECSRGGRLYIIIVVRDPAPVSRARYATDIFILLPNKYRNLAILIKYIMRLWCVGING